MVTWNVHGQDWTLFEEWLAQEQFETYKRLANPKTSEAETQQLRGRSMMIDLLLDLRNNPAGSDSPL